MSESATLSEARQSLVSRVGSPVEVEKDRVEQACCMLSEYTRRADSGSFHEARYLFCHLLLVLARVSGVADTRYTQVVNAEYFLYERFHRELETAFRYGAHSQAGDSNVRRSVEYFAARLGISVFQLNRCSRVAAQKTANELIKEALIAEATRLLLYTSVSVKEISQFLGYSNSSHFIRFFKLERGLAPDAFRTANTIFTRVQNVRA